jgi:DNA-directed RNA polymerase subunit F
MSEQNPGSNLKERDYRNWVEGQSTEALEKELSTLELRRTVLQNMDPEMEAEMTQEEQEEWAMEYRAKLAAARPEERKAIVEEYEGPDIDESTSQRIAEQLMIKPEKRAQPQAEIGPSESEIPSWISERVELNLHIRIVDLELYARRNQELSKGQAASALPTGSQQSKIDPDVVKRRTIVKQNMKLDTNRICRLFDLNAVPLALRGDDWEEFSTHDHPWADAYSKKPISEKRRRRIRVIISKDKQA